MWYIVLTENDIVIFLNTKHEIRNSKQMQIFKIQNVLNILSLKNLACFGFRYSNFGF